MFYNGVDKNEMTQTEDGILLNDKYENSVEDVNYVDTRIIYLTLKVNNGIIHFVNIYALDMNKPRPDNDIFRKTSTQESATT